MSRGLGKLQLAILGTLDDAKELVVEYTGRYGSLNSWGEEETIVYHGVKYLPPPDVYDMRASLQYLARMTGRVQTNLTLRRSTIARCAFSASFCRAVRGLVKRGYLEQVSAKVFTGRNPWGQAWPNRRLVRLTKKAISLLSADTYNAYRKQWLAEQKAREARVALWVSVHLGRRDEHHEG